MKSILPILFVAMPLLLLTSCYYDNLQELRPIAKATNCDTTVNISYSKDIKPIMEASCTQNCHNPKANEGSRDLTDYLQVNDAALNNGNTVCDGGILYGTMSWNPCFGNDMPKNGSKVSDCDLAKIKLWAKAGALNN